MRGVILPGQEKVDLRDFPTPEPGWGQVLIKMKASGLCGSDLRAIYREHTGSGAERYRNCIAGHEPCGVIETVGTGVSDFAPGDRVAVYHIAGCGNCYACRMGFMINCMSPARAAYGWQRDGGHADFLLTEQRTLVKLPDEVSFVDGALAACGYGTAYQATLKGNVSSRDVVLVVGLGPVGLGTVQLAAAQGAEVIGVDLVLERVELAIKAGAVRGIPAGEGAVEQILDATHGNGVEVAIDCSGSAPGRLTCLQAARDFGTVVFVGEGGTVTFEPSPLLLHKQLTLKGSWVCSTWQMQSLLEFVARKRIHPDMTVTHRFALEQADEAYRTFASGKTGKTVLTWD